MVKLPTGNSRGGDKFLKWKGKYFVSGGKYLENRKISILFPKTVLPFALYPLYAVGK